MFQTLKAKEITPFAENFRQTCQDWLLEQFPTVRENGLLDGKTLDKWLDYITVETKNKWQNGGRCWKILESRNSRKFFGASIKYTPQLEPNDTAMDTIETDTIKDSDAMDVEPPINLEDLAVFQAFNCPNCDFKSKDRIVFKTHIIENHDYIKGE